LRFGACVKIPSSNSGDEAKLAKDGTDRGGNAGVEELRSLFVLEIQFAMAAESWLSVLILVVCSWRLERRFRVNFASTLYVSSFWLEQSIL
jgi:hypothetical protein